MSSKLILRDIVRENLIDQINNGQLTVGKTINLAAISRKLGISVTPIREALCQLDLVGIVKAIPNRGFIVPELSYNEAKNLYETVSQLEVLALESTVFDNHTVQALKNEQLHLQQAHTREGRLTSRIRFHHLLVRNCTNEVLLQTLKNLESRVLFYEQMFVTDSSFYERIDNQNEAVIQAIEEDNVPTAALILKMNWISVFEYIQQQLILSKEVSHAFVY